MKRSAVNQAIAWAKDYLQKNNIHLPEYAYWPLETWKANVDKLDTVRKVMLGWDITDYGLDDFEHIGAVLYTVRNGSINDKSVGVPFAEKYIILRSGQRLTNHYHVAKTEDIINRAGGTLQLYLWNVCGTWIPRPARCSIRTSTSIWTAFFTPSSPARKCW